MAKKCIIFTSIYRPFSYAFDSLGLLSDMEINYYNHIECSSEAQLFHSYISDAVTHRRVHRRTTKSTYLSLGLCGRRLTSMAQHSNRLHSSGLGVGNAFNTTDRYIISASFVTEVSDGKTSEEREKVQ